jgi:hypothetical protein
MKEKVRSEKAAQKLAAKEAEKDIKETQKQLDAQLKGIKNSGIKPENITAPEGSIVSTEDLLRRLFATVPGGHVELLEKNLTAAKKLMQEMDERFNTTKLLHQTRLSHEGPLGRLAMYQRGSYFGEKLAKMETYLRRTPKDVYLSKLQIQAYATVMLLQQRPEFRTAFGSAMNSELNSRDLPGVSWSEWGNELPGIGPK